MMGRDSQGPFHTQQSPCSLGELSHQTLQQREQQEPLEVPVHTKKAQNHGVKAAWRRAVTALLLQIQRKGHPQCWRGSGSMETPAVSSPVTEELSSRTVSS